MQKLKALLGDGEITLQGLFRWGSNYTFLVNTRLGDQEVRAVYKPIRGEQPLWDFPSDTLAKREVAAYEVSEALGWGFVPLTVLRSEGPHGPGSIQLYVEGDPEDHYFSFSETEKKGLGRVVAFDVLLNNADRKGGHVIKDERGKVWLIDHGLSFHTDPKLRTVLWDLAGSALEKDIVADLKRFRKALERDKQLIEQLSGLLSPREIRALQYRTTRLIQNPCYPNPGAGRSYPWPPI